MDYLPAVGDALCNATDQDIQRYVCTIERFKFDQAIQKLRCLARKLDKAPPTPNPPPETNELAEALVRRLPELKNFFSEKTEIAVGQPPWKVDDYRPTNIRLVDGRARKKTLQAELRRALAERSLAVNFDAWNPYGLKEIVKTKSFEVRKTRQGSVRDFVRKWYRECI
ncbi:hypothetical protein M501DRAFT_604822 [Patellaria atrata CBS 101060]|uniref:Uncharacterized protein n=1 Tax=Patellaria atrata CBS 101060 TaxID=1346257 RepID=A0A9P4VIL1_9PEZI|nr:hypothetical protein M501DRAFT_604822 [Patellaria atrata CBS 101060]